MKENSNNPFFFTVNGFNSQKGESMIRIELTEKEALVVKGLLAMFGMIALMGNLKADAVLVKTVMKKITEAEKKT